MAVTALAGGSLLAVSASAAPALASTPAPLTVVTTSLGPATAGYAYDAKLDASGGTKPFSWSVAAGALPPGLTLHASTGEINGTPTTGGAFGFTIELTDSESPQVSATAPESITVGVIPLAVTTTALPAATAGVAYSTTLAASGGVAPYTWYVSVGSLPAGLKLHPATGVISGTPTAGGNFTFTAEVTDSEFTPQVSGSAEAIAVGVAGLVVTTGSTLPTATSGVPYSVKLSAAGGTTPYTWSLASGSLSAGLKLKSTGVLSGTTTASGPDSFTVQVTDSESPAAIATETVSLYVVTPMVVPTSLPGEYLGQSYSASLQPAGGLAPYSYAISSGSLPPGLSLDGGYITGTATANGVYDFTVAVTDSENPPATVTQAESITVTQAVIYVATDGSDSNPGVQGQPVLTIGAALTLAVSLGYPVAIDVAGGTYDEGSGINLVSNVTINGGYTESGWTQTSSTPTTIVGSPQAALADGATGVSINDVTLAPLAPATAGASVYGLRAIDGSSVALADVTINTPSITVEGNSLAGSPGSNGVPGEFGGQAGPGPDTTTCGSSTAGGTAGPGASDPSPTAGGTGGAGGDCGSNAGSAGMAGSGPNGGAGGAGGSLSGDPNGQPGTPGGNGTAGFGGSGGPNSPDLAGATWQGASGYNGGNGGNGGGGGGGGGGAGYGCFLCANAGGGGGAGGGSGGTGGGGGGGGAGGGAFGIYLDGSAVTFTGASTITVGNGGQGGYGGGGGYGAAGGCSPYPLDGVEECLGAPGGVSSSGFNAGYNGDIGGNGGNGAAGGGGGGGAGGPSIGIIVLSGGASGLGNTTITVGNGGAGGSGNLGGEDNYADYSENGQPGDAGIAQALWMLQ